MNLPIITPGQPETYNRKYRRALKVIAREPEARRRFTLVSELIGKPRALTSGTHHALVAAFCAAM